jgi:UDP-N-acetylmuramate--alanine ligase
MKLDNVFFIGVAGTGMSALAQYLGMQGRTVCGSDRQFNTDNEAPESTLIRTQLQKAGVSCYPQDASGLTKNLQYIVVSTAVEASNPELQLAQSLGLTVLHRSQALHMLSQEKKSIAIAGTSGKSTTVAMLFHILQHCGLKPSLLTGAGLSSLEQKGYIGNAWADQGEWLVFEADESDGTLVQYTPDIGCVLNIEKDHKEISELVPLFEQFAKQSKTLVLNESQLVVAQLQSLCHSSLFFNPAHWEFTQDQHSIAFSCQPGFESSASGHSDPTVSFTIPVPGRHNMENALAATTIAQALGVSAFYCAKALASYAGIYRRHQIVATHNNITIIDDFAHNPAKIAASIRACQPMGARVLAWFQPHGYGPTRFLRHELTHHIAQALRPQDFIFMSEIYYAGGTVTKDISAKDLIADIQAQLQKEKEPLHALFFAHRNDCLQQMLAVAQSGDVILLMGARDPSLGNFARQAALQLVKS